MNAVERKSAQQRELIQLYLKELVWKLRISEPDLRKRVAGCIDKVANGFPIFAFLGIDIDFSSLLNFVQGLKNLLFSDASELLHKFVSCLSSLNAGYCKVQAVTASDCFRSRIIVSSLAVKV